MKTEAAIGDAMHIGLPEHIDTYVFDLDNTLYPAACNLFPSMDVRMSRYIANLLGLSAAEAKIVQHRYYEKYGTTLAGLMKHHQADPMPFLDYVHDVDLSPLDRVDDLGSCLQCIDGRKLIFTNGSRKHAVRILEYLGISAFFDGIYAIDDADFTPKPEMSTYKVFCERFDITPQTAVFFEDLSVNLRPAKELGFLTVLIDEDCDHEPAWVDHIAPCLRKFLQADTSIRN